jgi:arylsulfatase
VLVGIDTLRADHLGCYGYPRPTSPRIDALARESALFTTAIAPAPWTLPSFASILTGLLPSHHRAGEGSPTGGAGLDASHPTLATILRDAGYATASFVSNGWVSTRVGLARGFDEHGIGGTESAARDGVRFIERQATGRPFFLFVHLLAPHAPYEPPAEDAEPFVDRTYTGPIGLHFDPNRRVESTADLRRAVDLYDGEIHFADRMVGTIVDALERRGLLDRTVIVVTADHGEELHERGAFGHGTTLYDEQLHVPLLIRLPRARLASRVERQVRTLDVMPTLLDALGMTPPAAVDGVSLLPLLRGGPMPADSEQAFAEFLTAPVEQKAIRLQGEKLILTPSTGATALYDLAADPRELTNVGPERAPRAGALARVVHGMLVGAATGFRLTLQNIGSGDRFELRLSTPKGFAGAEPVHLEPDDVVTIAPDHTHVDLLLNGSDPLAEIDAVHLTTNDPRAIVRIERATMNGEPCPSDIVVAGESLRPITAGPPPWLVLRSAATTAPTPNVPLLPKGAPTRLVVAYVAPPAPPAIEFDEALHRHLHELGYLP